jgi:hypothetical protein
MRVTRSSTRSQALAEAQAALLQAAEQVQAQAQAFALQVIENHTALENTAPLPTVEGWGGCAVEVHDRRDNRMSRPGHKAEEKRRRWQSGK